LYTDPERFPRKKAVGKRSDTRRDPKFKVPNSSWKSKNNITPDQDYEKYKDCQWGWSQNSSGAIWDWSNYPNNNLFGTTNTGINKNHGERKLSQNLTLSFTVCLFARLDRFKKKRVVNKIFFLIKQSSLAVLISNGRL
jgi:hypothetical protein